MWGGHKFAPGIPSAQYLDIILDIGHLEINLLRNLRWLNPP
jgi:hypothetical protein